MTERMTDGEFSDCAYWAGMVNRSYAEVQKLVTEARRAREAEGYLQGLAERLDDDVLALTKERDEARIELNEQVLAKCGIAGQLGNALVDVKALRARVERLTEALKTLRAKVCEFWCSHHEELSTSHHPSCDEARAALRDEQEKSPAPLGPFCRVEEWCAMASGHDGACTTTQVLMARDEQEKGG